MLTYLTVKSTLFNAELQQKYMKRYQEIKHLRNKIVDVGEDDGSKITYSCNKVEEDLSLRDYAILCGCGDLPYGAYVSRVDSDSIQVEVYTD